MANPWLRLWTDFANDPKFRTIARIAKQRIGDVQAVYIHLLIAANSADERGNIASASSEDIASALDLDASDVESILAAMEGRVVQGGILTGWMKRQPLREDASSTDRVRQHREAKRQAAAADETQNGATGTGSNALKRDETQSNAPEKIREEEKREDKVKNKSSAAAPLGRRASAPPEFVAPDWVDPELWAGFLDSRLSLKARNTPRALQILVDELDHLRSKGNDSSAVLKASIMNGWKGVFELKRGQRGKSVPKHDLSALFDSGSDPLAGWESKDDANGSVNLFAGCLPKPANPAITAWEEKTIDVHPFDLAEEERQMNAH